MTVKIQSHKGDQIELKKYEHLLKMEDAILAILKDCRGVNNRVSRRRLRAILQVYFNKVRDRDMRLIIADLRKRGEPICSMCKAGGGYWYAANPEELEYYIIREMKSRIRDMRGTIEALEKTGREIWGELVETRVW